MEECRYRFVVVELSSALLRANYESLQSGGGPEIHDSRAGHLQFVEADALGFERTMGRLGVSAVDAVVSSLPLFYFKPETRWRLLRGIRRRLREGGQFLQYRYTPQGAAELGRFFSQVQRRFVMNFLPAWMFIGRRTTNPGP